MPTVTEKRVGAQNVVWCGGEIVQRGAALGCLRCGALDGVLGQLCRERHPELLLDRVRHVVFVLTEAEIGGRMLLVYEEHSLETYTSGLWRPRGGAFLEQSRSRWRAAGGIEKSELVEMAATEAEIGKFRKMLRE